jgi:predicted HAD superfamily Cof-like phosphohydrolase
MSKTSLEMVREFHETYNQPINNFPTLDNEKVNELRISLIQEELNELKEALDNKNPVEVLDALTDLQYVLDGAYISLGFQYYKQAGLEEVHASNMSKLGEDGKPIYREDGKVLKGPKYFKANLEKVIDKVTGYINMTSQLKELKP